MKDLKISKELLSEVLKLEVVKHSLYNELHRSFNITYMPSEDSLKSRWMPINTYEFAFKCKEWALQKGYKIQTQINSEDKGHSHITKINNDSWAKGFFEDTEIEAIIKACEFILTKKESK